MRTPKALNLVLAAGYALGGFALWSGLSAPMAAFLLPTALAITNALLRGLCMKHPVGESSPATVLPIYDAIMLRFTLFMMAVHAAVLFALLGAFSAREWAARIVPMMLGATMISVGNLLPRTRPNLAIGIRTRRTLADRAAWIRTHRLAGYVSVASGVVIALSAITIPKPVGTGMVLVVGPCALVGTWLLLVMSRGRRAHA